MHASVIEKRLPDYLDKALACRQTDLKENNTLAIRLFNGFTEGNPDLVIDLYGKTLLIHNYADTAEQLSESIQTALEFYTQSIPWIEAVLLKEPKRKGSIARQGRLIWGQKTTDRIQENAVWYALNLQINRDASFFLDTRNLRYWAKNNLSARKVLNTFAYTGSLGVAAKAGGAQPVIQLDQSKVYLDLARESYRLNQLPWQQDEFIIGDFFSSVGHLKRKEVLFDCVFLDPPYYSRSPRGLVDLFENQARLINKVRPLVAHNGWLVTVNNALYVSGQAYYQVLQDICSDGYVSIEAIIPIPPDCTGFPETIHRELPFSPAPFNHSTKIAVLRVRRKDQHTC